MRKFTYSLILAFAMLPARTAIAQDAAGMPKGLRGEMLMNASDVEQKILGLVSATPQDKFTWRPMEGVRSVSEVFLHISGANYLFPSFAGAAIPEGIDLKKLEESTTNKSKIAEIVKASFASFRDNLTKLSDADLEKPTKMFGMETTYRNVYLIALTHMHEHLGQSIAYARSNGVVPPWTAAQEAKMKEKAKKGM
jgi:uncharacterized damage-inducible protein DinB